MPVPVMPCVELLERRNLLTVSLSAGGTLAIAGRRRDDDVEIFLNAILPKHLLVTINGVETVFEAARVRRIYVNCGEGNDSVEMQNASEFVSVHGGPVSSVERPTTLLGGSGIDDLEGGDGGNFIDGQDGDDLVYGGQGDDTLLGGDGDDGIYAANVGATSRGRSIIRGGNGNDFLNGGNGNDFISGGPGKDVINGRGGRDTLQGDSGHDVIIATDPGTKGGIVQGGPGDDALSGRAGVSLFGGPGSDDFSTPAFSWVKDAEIGETVHLQ